MNNTVYIEHKKYFIFNAYFKNNNIQQKMSYFSIILILIYNFKFLSKILLAEYVIVCIEIIQRLLLWWNTDCLGTQFNQYSRH